MYFEYIYIYIVCLSESLFFLMSCVVCKFAKTCTILKVSCFDVNSIIVVFVVLPLSCVTIELVQIEEVYICGNEIEFWSLILWFLFINKE